ncbi:5'-3' exonuclease [[Mycoplasma] testudinis]|uniref:5'-3' exonuclease n=1 Tax=[Mycoplasma] testudinis TaxID=33924 RepID=UPI0004804D9B|nr:5'-3' exonuclease [[Mycoplasma] testudinis]
MRNCAVVIDGHSLTYRAYYATLKQMEYYKETNKQPTNAIKLMLLISLKILNEHNPKYALIAFDAGQKTFRDDLFDDYKAGRPHSPDELRSQLQLLQEVLVYAGYNVRTQIGVEADDLIGSFVSKTTAHKIVNYVYTSDKDMLQLVNEYTNVMQPKKGISEMTVYTKENFPSLYYGLNPAQVIEFKSIVGDSSDKLPGVKGIGIKTGIDLLLKYGSLDNIYENLSELRPAQQKLFNEHKKTAYLCKKLATIKCDCYDAINLNEFLRKTADLEKLTGFLQKYQIRNLENEIYRSVQLFDEGE